MKGKSSSFESSYNTARSSSVRIVSSVNDLGIHNEVSNGTKGIANSVNIIRNKSGIIIQERYYNEVGDVYLDIDYTDHGNPKTHPIVPHEHSWAKDNNGNFKRNTWKEIKK